MINKQNIKNIYPLSMMQESMLFFSLLDNESNAYFEQTTYKINGELNLNYFEKAINELLERHDILRTVFVHKNVTRPFQVVLKQAELHVKVIDLTTFSKENQLEYFNELKKKDLHTPFALSTDVLMRVVVVKYSDTAYEVIWSHHHILMDGWCMGILIGEFLQIYKSKLKGTELKLQPEVPYISYIKWLEKQDKKQALSYWENYLAEIEEPTSLPKLVKEAAHHKKCVMPFKFDTELCAKLNQLSKEEGITINILFQVAWGIVLQKLNNTERAVFGTVVSGRPAEIPQVGSILGLFINTIPTKIVSYEKETWLEQAKRVLKENSQTMPYEYLPLADIQNTTSLKNNLIDHILVFENYPVATDIEKLDTREYGFTISDIKVFEQTNYDLNVIVIPKHDTLSVKFDFNESIYSKELIEETYQRLNQVLEQFAFSKRTEAVNINLLLEAERKKLEHEYNQPIQAPLQNTVVDLIEKQAAAHPDATALYYDNKKISYRELNEKSNGLAEQLITAHGIKSGDLVAVLADRSDKIIITILAILKAGAAYIPIDKAYPEDRIGYILEDSATKLLITDTDKKYKVPVLSIHTEYAATAKQLNHATTDGLAYIIYTSGSTGNPKGCLIKHTNLMHYIDWANRYYFLNSAAEGNFTLYTSLSFDLTITSIFSPLTRGKALYIYNQTTETETILKHTFSENKAVDIVKITPAHITLLKYLGISKTHIKAAIVGGEELTPDQVAVLKDLNPSLIIFNEYGPTETTVGCIVKAIEHKKDKITIGKPIDNTQIVILDKHNKLSLNGAIGEIGILGNGVGAGYLNRPELNAQKFVMLPEIAQHRIYKTGDLGRWLPNGEIDFLGRIDHQVKVRGYRIELGEIEQQLLQTKAISEAVVIDVKETTGGKILCAYITATGKADTQQLKRAIAQHLPEYMVPDFIVQLEKIPLTVNGKVDRKALPNPALQASAQEYVAPATENEIKLAKIWTEVLGIEKIGLNDNFFHLGGHSLKTTILSSRIAKEFEKEITLKQIFENPVLREQLELIEGTQKAELSTITKVQENESYPLSFAQKRFYLLQQFDENSVAYNISGVLKAKGKLNIAKVEKVLNKIAQRQEVLRTYIEIENDEPVQKIVPDVHFKVHVKEIESELNVDSYIRAFVQPFDMSKAPLLKVEALKIQEDEYIMLFDMPHIVSDGVSRELLVNEFVTYYNNGELPELEVQYKDFAVWQGEFVKTEKYKKQEAYWLNRFADMPDPVELSTDFARPTVQDYKGSTITTTVEKDLLAKLNKFAKEQDTTLFMLLESTFKVLLYKFSGQKDLVIGTPVSGRTKAEIANIFGVFINTLALRTRIIDDLTFTQFLQNNKKEILDAFDNQDYPFELLVEKLGIKADLSKNPLFDIMFILQNTDNKSVKLDDMEITPYHHFDNNTSKFDITLEIFETEEKLEMNFEYATSLFKEKTIRNLSDRYIQLLTHIVSNAETKLADYSIVLPAEKIKLQEFNATDMDFPSQTTIHRMFEEQVQKTPEAIAVRDGERILTYKELNEKANQLAHHLRGKGVVNEQVVPILVERTAEMVIGLMGIIKAGGAYLPIDPELPADRISYMLEDSKAGVLLTLKSMPQQEFGGQKIYLDEASIYTGKNTNPETGVKPDNLVYVIYTSGSTGRPKGTMLEHAGVVNRIHWMRNKYAFNEKDIVIQKTTYAFDVSVWEFFMTLCYGAELVVCKKEVIYDPELLINELEKNKITTLHFVPSMFNVFLSKVNNDNKHRLKHIRQIFTSGEALALESVKRHHTYLSHAKLHNLYGPTEASVDVTYFETGIDDENVPIGKAIDNIQLYILDSKLKEVPIGVAGELHIAGIGVARGYLNKEQLTNEKFVPNPFGKGKLYKTGDLTKWMPDGNILYLGRIDHQIKIRGYRIELGEIEQQIRNIAGVEDAAVIPREINKEQTLCAYIVSPQQMDIDAIRARLQDLLPNYMVPTFIIQIEKIPLSPNGKLDRKALPNPENMARNRVQNPPVSETEKQLAEVWKLILSVEDAYLDDDFFEMGGHSLKASLLVARIEKTLGVKIPMIEVFKRRTIAQLAQYIEQTGKHTYVALKPAPEHATYPLSGAQQRMYFLNQLEGVQTSYHLPNVLKVTGKLDVKRLEEAIQKLIDRNEILRTGFEIENHQPVQRVHPKVKFKLEKITGKGTVEKAIKDFVRPFDLTQPTQMRVGVKKESDELHYLLFDMHHIITDGVSMGVIVKEFTNHYKGAAIVPHTVQYKDFAWWQHLDEQKKAMQSHENYWLSTFRGEIPVLNLPTDFARPATQSFEGDNIEFALTKEQTQKLNKLAKDTDSTLYMVLLSVYSILIAKYSNQEDVVVGTPVAGRTQAEMQEQIGMFVNTLAMRSLPEKQKTYEQYLKEVRANSLEAFDHQDYPFENIVEKLDVPRSMNRNPLFDTMFMLQNMEGEKIQLEGLTFESYPIESKIAKFDLTLQAVEEKDALRMNLEYSTKLYKKETATRIAEHFSQLVDKITTNPKQKIAEISLVTATEKKQLIENFNETKTDYPQGKNVLDLFAEQVSKNGKAVALEYNGKTLTYKQLEESSNQLARLLTEKYNVKAGELIAIQQERTEKVIISMLGVLKAGAAYLPIDNSLPENRVQYIMGDAGVRIQLASGNRQLTENNTQTTNNKIQITTIDIEQEWEQIEQQSKEALQTKIAADQLAYVIYTSGSTGLPKGCEIEHRNLYNYVQYAVSTYFVNGSGHFGLYTNLSFDLTITSIYGALLNGKTLTIYPGTMEISEILQHTFDASSKIDAVKITPAHISLLKHMDLGKSNVKTAVVGGEQLTLDQIAILRKINPKMSIFNEYGPTETTVGCIVKEIGKDDEKVLIGKPIANTQIYILDESMQVVPVGVPGEIWIGGKGVGRGYLNRVELTAERFRKNTFSGEGNIYKTGDVARWLSNGEIEYIGRIDHQVKIRGYRIELGEIENQLLKVSGVKEVTVIDRTDKSGEKYLVAYYVGDAVAEGIKSAIAEELPSYMVPGYFVQLKTIPLTTNGKVDRTALPEPIKESVMANYVVPKTDEEKMLAEIWQSVLSTKRIGANDDFFQLGGDSIKAIQLASRLKNKGYKLEIKDVFANSVLKDMALAARKEANTISQEEVTGVAPLTAIQREFLQNKIDNKDHYNQSVMLYSESGFDENTVQRTFEKLLEQHDALRIHLEDDRMVNMAVKEVDFSVKTYKGLSAKEIEKKANELQKKFDTTKAPLIQAALFNTTQGDHLLIIIHHLVVDGISWRAILEDFETAYKAITDNQKPVLPLKTNSFIQWATEINNYANTTSFVNKNSYWFSKDFEHVEPLFHHLSEEKAKVTRQKIALTEAETKALLTKSNQAFGTEINDLLLTALTNAVYELTHHKQFVVAMEGHGREQLIPYMDISRTVGWFTSSYPVLLNANPKNQELAIIETKEALRRIPQKGVGYGILKYLTDKKYKTGFNENLHPQILFNYLGQFDDTIASDLFKISQLSAGENSSSSEKEYAIELNGLVAKNVLSFDIDFDVNYISQSKQDEFVSLFEAKLKEIVAYCTARTERIKTPSDFGLKNISYAELLKIQKRSNAEIEKIYPLSPMQQGMLFFNLMDRENEAYFEQTIITIAGNLSVELFEKTYNQIIQKHEILRSNALYSELAHPHQIIYKEKFSAVYYEDLSSSNANEQQEKIVAYLAKEKKQGFDLSRDVLMKASVFKVKENEHKVVWTHHHIILDGWCLGIIFNDFFTLYNINTGGEGVEQKPSYPYSNYIHWIEEQDKDLALEYWRSVVEDCDTKVMIPGAIKNPAEGYVQKNVELVLSETQHKQLNELAAANKVTLYNVLQTIWGIQLQKYNNTEEVIFGSVVSGRPAEVEGIENIVGLFINTVPVKVGRRGNFVNTLTMVQQQATNSNQFEYLPLNEIQALSTLKNELINHLMIFENYPLDKEAQKINKGNKAIEITNVQNFERTNYDFTITILPTDHLTVSFDYNANAYSTEYMEIVKSNFENILNQVLQNPAIDIPAIELLTNKEAEALMERTASRVRDNKGETFVSLFDKTVKKYGENVALRYNVKTMTYAEFDEQTNQVANYLIKSGVKANDAVGIFATPSFEMMIGLLGILKSGAGYLPIDINYPSDRISFMLEDSKAKYLLANQQLSEELTKEVTVIDLNSGFWNKENRNHPKTAIAISDLAYIIYTSGSTGKPKGVTISHANFADYILTILEMFDYKTHDVMLQHASIAFDTTIEELYPILCSGGSLYLPLDNKDFEEMLHNIATQEVTMLCTSPLVLNYINEEAKSLGILRLITVGGDELKASFVDKLIDKIEVWNGYGPTETTVCATYYKVRGDEDQMPIGKPITNRKAYVLNTDRNLLPYGVPGELCVSGEGTAKGYLNREDLTKEKFVKNPYEADKKLYRTGDLVCWNEEGDLNFYGRIDSQVKIRGFRIELGEIENKLSQHPNVKEATVLAWDDENNGKFLCTYVVGKITEASLREYLEKDLPDYMVPSFFVFLDKMPITVNGKTDRKALKKPDSNELAMKNYVAAETDVQKILTDVWVEILNVKQIGIDTNFFSLGGDSIKAIQIASRIQKHNLKVELKDIFRNPTIRELEPFVRSLQIQISQEPETGTSGLVPIQLAFFEEKLPHQHHYNQSVMLFSKTPVQESSLSAALAKLVAHHDTLRMVFTENGGTYKAVDDKNIVSLEVVENNTTEQIEQHAQKVQESFDIGNGPLFKAVIYRTVDGDHLLLVAHHLVIDGISWRILLEDLQNLIQGETELPAKTHSYKVWAEKLKEYAVSPKLANEINYWKQIEQSAATPRVVPLNTYDKNTRIGFILTKEETEMLLKEVNKAYTTEINDILIAALASTLKAWNGKEDNVIFLEGHGREELFEDTDINRTVGWFTSMYPVLISEEKDMPKLIKDTKENLRKIPNKGIGYGVLRYLSGSTEFKLKPEITFNYLGQFDDTFKEGALGVSKLSAGNDVSLKNTKESILDVSGMVVDRKLKMDFMYNPEITPLAEVEQMKENYKKCLMEIVNHCLQKEGVERTASDFDTEDLSNEELDDIMNLLDGI